MMGFFMLIFCQTIMLNFFIKRFYVNLKEEFSVYEAGGVLQRFAQDFLEGQVA